MCGDDLVDFRVKLKRKAHSVLFAKATATGRDMQELAREIIDRWAADELHASTVMQRVLRSEGVVGESGGSPEGVMGECTSPGKGRA